ncbi:MAG TPA: RIP metalloprotease RseP [Flavobacteriaceae bacterium]|jgi:regulator of sigma E protease|nr:RIP metalloprotease RseP [Flavobacteriaceae bacterium]HIB47333.1 RIP metalloprotease RseP [Flavobacteriaceae bacterium]HIN99148.1 RIP metalloprotease RseP [Flavobacteriaceae bacterium]|tara:strand:+ start:28013 stop:29338 length:1326 start_codon:yes stop_codon:yes gene_type:complete
MSPFAVKAIQLLLSLSILIILHELGHFIPAKLFKTRVEKFFLFFDVKFALLKKKIGETTYGIGWLPLGGYVKISGMIDESMDKEQMAQPAQPWEFRSKPAWQRLIIMLGGVTVNVIVGMVIYIFLFYNNGQRIVTNENLPNGFSVAQEFKALGFEDGDRVLQLNGKDFENLNNLNRYLMLRDVETLTVLHPDGNQETIELPEDIGMTMFKAGVREPFTPMRTTIIDTIYPDLPAGPSDLRVGDRVLQINGTEVTTFRNMSELVRANPEKPVALTVLRNGETLEFTVTPNDKGQLGINNLAREYDNSFEQVNYSFGESIGGGIEYGYNVLKDYVYQFKYVFTAEGATQIGGFGAIGGLFPDTWDWSSFWHTTALISIILAFMNILPIPALDGGHVMFLLYEMVSGRKPNDKFMEYAQMVGFFLLIGLVLFANGNDIYRWLFE